MRFQAELQNRDAAILRGLMEELQTQSNAELLTHLLSIASWAVSERRQGRRLASVSAEGPVRELVSPLLERVAQEHALPRVDINWTPQELRDLASLASAADPAPPTERLVRVMKKRR
jgi:hypothetical protein